MEQQTSLNSLEVLEKSRKKISETGELLNKLRFKVKESLAIGKHHPNQLFKVTQHKQHKQPKQHKQHKSHPPPQPLNSEQNINFNHYQQKISQIQTQLQRLNHQLNIRIDKPHLYPPRSTSQLMRHGNPYKSQQSAYFPPRNSLYKTGLNTHRAFGESPRKYSGSKGMSSMGYGYGGMRRVPSHFF